MYNYGVKVPFRDLVDIFHCFILYVHVSYEPEEMLKGHFCHSVFLVPGCCGWDGLCLLLCPAPIGGGALSVDSRRLCPCLVPGSKSRTERPRNPKIDSKEAHDPGNL